MYPVKYTGGSGGCPEAAIPPILFLLGERLFFCSGSLRNSLFLIVLLILMFGIPGPCESSPTNMTKF